MLCLVSTELFVFVFLMSESFTLKTLGPFLRGKKKEGDASLIFIPQSLEVAVIHLERKKRMRK